MDDFFNSRLHNRNMEFDANDWRAMESILDQQDRKKRRIFPFFWLATGISLCAFLGFVLFKNQEDVSDKRINSKEAIIEIQENYAVIESTNEQLSSFDQLAENEQNNKKVHANPTSKVKKNHPSFAKNLNNKIHELIKKDATIPSISTQDGPRITSSVDQHDDNLKSIEEEINLQAPVILVQMLSDKQYQMIEKELDIQPMDVLLPSLMESYVEPHLSLGIGGGVIGSSSGFAGFETGLLADYHFNKSWAIQSGFLYSQRNLGSVYSRIREDVSYDFGQVSTIYGMNAQSLAFGSLPLIAYYKTNKNQVGAGIAIDFLFGVKGEIQEVTLMESTERSKIKEVKNILQTGWIDMTAFQKTNARMQLNYRREIFPSVFVGSNVSYQMSPILKTSPQILNDQKIDKLFIGLNMQLFLQ